MKTIVENFQFTNAAELRDWLNRFETTDLSAVYFAHADYLNIGWREEILSDGSVVRDMIISLG